MKAEDAPLWTPFEDRRRLRDEKRRAVLNMAVQLFLEVGYHRATLTDVATRLNITKPALYNYFRGKEEILDECVQLGQEMLEDSIKAIEGEGGDSLTRIRKLIRAYAMVMTTNFGMCQVRLDDRELSEDAQRRVRAKKRRYDGVLRRYIEEGIADGTIAKCDPKLSAFAIAGSLNWIGHWYQPGGRLSAEAVADEFALRLTEGLVAKKGGRPATKGSAKKARTSD